ncbi:YitT family protein [Tropicimonas sp.]|uniref:YitT family protein n=1 Tax=Tropicimonas sp. TaxID=2067044 RepID=UPI003A863546
MPAPVPPADPALRHTPLEDAQGLSTGVLVCSVAMLFLTHLGFLTGQTAGLALLISYVAGWPFGAVFLVVNLPFYWLAWTRMGREFTLKSLGCVALLSLLVDLMPQWVQLGEVQPLVGMTIFGALTGLGLIVIFRHGASLGGLGIVALMVQDRFGFRAGYLQLIFDVVLFAVAAMLFPGRVVAYSLFGAVVLNGIIAVNHRRDRYIAL